MKRILTFMLAAVLLTLCLAACGKEGNVDNAAVTTTTKPVSTTKAPDNFDHAFSIRGLVYSEYEFSAPESIAFVGLTTDDTLELFEFGCENGVVKEATKTLYLNVEGYDANQKMSIKQAMEDNFSEAASLDSVTITHEILDKYYMLKVELKHLDSPDILNADIKAGLLDYFTDEFSGLSVADVENVMNLHNFIKR